MSATTEIRRKYALTKIACGDYLLPSNDGQTIWRLCTYEDGPSHGLEEWPRDVTLWGVWKWTGAGDAVDPGDWGQWDMWEGTLQTRAEAIHAALKMRGDHG
jgi:hypothetical protein